MASKRRKFSPRLKVGTVMDLLTGAKTAFSMSQPDSPAHS